MPIKTTCTEASATVAAKISTLFADVKIARHPVNIAEKTMIKPSRMGVR